MKKENLVSVPFMVLGIVFCVCLVAANLLETKVVQLGPISVTAGLIVFPISYIINDCIAEVWGFRKARLIIWMGFLMNFMVVAMGQLAVALPAAPFWEGEESFNFVFGMAPRIAVASLTAFLVGSFYQCVCDEPHESGFTRKEFLCPCRIVDDSWRGSRLADFLPAGFWRTDAGE